MSKSFSTRFFIPFIFAFLVAAILGACGGDSNAPTAAPVATAGPNANVALAPEAKVDEPAAAAVPPPEPLPLPWAPAPVIKERAAPPPAVSALGAVVVDEASNAVLFDK